MSANIVIGDTFVSKATIFMEKNGIPPRVEFVVANTDGNLVSVTLKYSGGKMCPSRITITKELFASNFEGIRYFVPIDKLAATSKHHFPEVNSTSCPIFPSHPCKL